MQIVIELDKRSWEEIQNTKKHEPTTMNWYEEQIANGTPLPENGKIVDMEDDVVFDLLRQYISFGTLCDLIDEMPSVLDAKGDD